MDEETRELQVIERGQEFMPVLTSSQAIVRYEAIRDCVKTALVNGVDYGRIPGTGDKPTLLKPGAEKLCTFFGLTARFLVESEEEDWTGALHGGEMFFRYSYRCQLFRGDMRIAECMGSCSSWETKYRYRNADRKCPKCGKDNIRKSNKGEGGWYCWVKTGGCAATFQLNDTTITEQKVGKIPNPDIADQVNTIQKMAQKRSYVGAVKIAVNASGIFAEDLEDNPPQHTEDADADTPPIQQPARKTESVKPAQAKPAQAAAPKPLNFAAFTASIYGLGANLEDAASACEAIYNHRNLDKLTRTEAGQIFKEIQRGFAESAPAPPAGAGQSEFV